MAVQAANSKVFISYSWTTETHEAWVLELATRLMQDGVPIILERWWPRLIIYSGRSQTLSLFARSESLSFFKSWTSLIFGEISITDFQTNVTKLAETFRGIYGYPSPNLSLLTNSTYLGTRP